MEQSQQPGVEQNSGHVGIFQEKPPNTASTHHPRQNMMIVESFRFLGTTITRDLQWDSNISSFTKRAQQRMYLLHQLKKFNLPQELMVQFYTVIVESVITTSITV